MTSNSMYHHPLLANLYQQSLRSDAARLRLARDAQRTSIGRRIETPAARRWLVRLGLDARVLDAA